MTAIVETHDAGYAYHQPHVRALSGVEMAVEPGQVAVVMGPNGSGKTTFVKLLLGLMQPTEGWIKVDGRNLAHDRTPVRRAIGYVPQHGEVNNLLPVSVRDVVGLGAYARYRFVLSLGEIRRRVDMSLDMVDLTDLASRPFPALSGGQQQRALIARALAVDPRILIADEPFAAVDAASQQTIGGLLQHLSREKHVTVIAVVHDVNPLVHFMDRVLLLNTRMIAYGEPEEVLTSTNLQEAYGRAVPVLVCDEGFLHPITEARHE